MEDTSTITASATPSGQSALATVRVSGNGVLSIVKDAFGKKDPVPRKVNFGNYNSVSGKVLDECLWCFFRAPSSYTGENMLEISCHGNPFIVKRILKDLCLRGCRIANPGEFTRRAFMNGKMELTQAEAVMDIISAKSESSFEAARKLLLGELGKRITSWNNWILNLLAEIEVQIDFSEEEVPSLDIDHFKNEIEILIRELKNTRNSARYSEKIHEGINVVIFGAPNAGKSSLLNAVVGFDRSIVSSEAGTTRDFIMENISIGKYCINIFDTAGLRDDSGSDIETLGMERTLSCIKNADFLIFVIDSSELPPALPQEMESLKDKILIVFNKSDRVPAFEKDQFLPEIEKISLSLKQDAAAADKFCNRLRELLEKKEIVPPDDLLIVSSRHSEALAKAEHSLLEAQEIIGSVPVEFISSKLRYAVEELAEIVGNFDNEKVLDKVFSGFCIGK